MICDKCNQPIEIVLIDGKTRELHESECKCKAIYFYSPQGEFINDEQIQCPFCKQYPFKEKIKGITHWDKVLCSLEDEYEISS